MSVEKKFLRELPETVWEQDTSSGCFDLRSSLLAGTRTALSTTSQKGFGQTETYRACGVKQKI